MSEYNPLQHLLENVPVKLQRDVAAAYGQQKELQAEVERLRAENERLEFVLMRGPEVKRAKCPHCRRVSNFAVFSDEKDAKIAELEAESIDLYADRERLKQLREQWDEFYPEAVAIKKAQSAKIAELEEWKESAMKVLSKWDEVYEAAGRPGKLGGSKAEAVKRYLNNE